MARLNIAQLMFVTTGLVGSNRQIPFFVFPEWRQRVLLLKSFDGSILVAYACRSDLMSLPVWKFPTSVRS